VEGEDHVRAVADGKLTLDVNTSRLQRVDLGDEGRGIQHQPVADDGFHARTQDSRRDELEDELLLADAHGVAGVVAALVAATMSKRSENRSTILPLPSSPHCAPNTIRLVMRVCPKHIM